MGNHKIITCEDFENLGMWYTGFCDREHHEAMKADMMNAELLFVQEPISLPYKFGDRHVAVFVCCNLASVAQRKLSMKDLEAIVEGRVIVDGVIAKMFTDNAEIPDPHRK